MIFWCTLSLLGAGCATAGDSERIDNDLEAFTRGIEDILKIGMNIKEARRALLTRLPKPRMNTEVTAPIPGNTVGMRTKRYMLVWQTMTDDTSMVVTIFCERDGRVVRWTVGTLTEGP